MNLSSPVKPCVLFCNFLPELNSAGLRTLTPGLEDYRVSPRLYGVSMEMMEILYFSSEIRLWSSVLQSSSAIN